MGEFWIHIAVFIIAFVITGVVLLKRQQKEGLIPQSPFEEIQAEIVTEGDTRRHYPLCEDGRGWSEDPYKFLGVHRNDSIETIESVFTRLMDIYEPNQWEEMDTLAKSERIEHIEKLTSAYNWIKNHHK